MGWCLVAASFAAGVRAELRCFRRDTKAESHPFRRVEVGRDLWRSPGPRPLLKQAHLEPVAQEHGLLSFGYLLGAAP